MNGSGEFATEVAKAKTRRGIRKVASQPSALDVSHKGLGGGQVEGLRLVGQDCV